MDVRSQKLAQIQYNTAKQYLEQGEYELAAQNYRMAINMYPDYAEAHFYLGITLFLLKNYNPAILSFSAFLKLNPMESDCFSKQVEVFFESIKYDCTIENFFTALTQLEAYHFNYNDRGAFYFRVHKYDLAITDFTKDLESNPSSIGYANRGYARFKNQQYDLSLEDLNIAIALSDRSSNAYAHRGEVHVCLKQYDAAIADMSKAVALNPTDKKNIEALQKLFIDNFLLDDVSGIKTSSLHLVLDIIEKIPNEEQKDWLRLLNEIYVKMKVDNTAGGVANIFGYKSGNLDEAMEKFLSIQTKHKINMTNIQHIVVNALYERAEAYHKAGLFICAIENITKIILLDDKYGEAYNLRGMNYHNIEQHYLAIADFDKAIALGHLGAYINRGYSRFKLNQHDLALADLSKGIEEFPTAAVGYSNRGYLYFTQGDFKLAIKDYVKALSFDVEHGNANKHLEEIFNCVRTKNDIRKIGISSLELVFEIVPKFPEDEQRNWLIMLNELNMRIKAINSSLGFSILNQYKLSRADKLEKKIDEFILKIDLSNKKKKECQANFDDSGSDEENNELRNFYSLS